MVKSTNVKLIIHLQCCCVATPLYNHNKQLEMIHSVYPGSSTAAGTAGLIDSFIGISYPFTPQAILNNQATGSFTYFSNSLFVPGIF